MPATKSKSKSSSDRPAVENSAELGQDVGFIGTKVDPRPNEDWSLESGPDSPTVTGPTAIAEATAAADDGDK